VVLEPDVHVQVPASQTNKDNLLRDLLFTPGMASVFPEAKERVMSDAEPTYLRIYCLCGQKMKVSGLMYGLPGKCVACRLKIRIPRLDEIPAGVDEIHLKDHPEFVRKRRLGGRVTAPPPTQADGAPAAEQAPALSIMEEQYTPQEDELVLLGEEQEPTENLPLDVFDFLRKLCSLKYKIEKSLATEGIANPDEPGEVTSRAARDLLAQRRRLEDTRADLDEELRQRLLETAIELTSTQEKLGEANLDARVGKLQYGEYAEQVAKLRERRERLERQQQNLRGWLRARDPFLAGGFVDVPPADVIALDGPPSVPLMVEELPSVLNGTVDWLRSALQRREAAERTLREIGSARKQGEISERRASLAVKDIEAQKTLAEAAITFYRHRLEQLRSDYRRDLEVLESQQDLLRSGHDANAIGRGYFESREKELLRSRADCAKAIDLVDRVLTANLAQEVPPARGTFLGRLSSAKHATFGRDAWTAWAAALLILASVFLPLAPGLSMLAAYSDPTLRGGGAQWTLLFAVVAAVAAGLAAGIPMLRGRAVALLTLWTVFTVAGLWLLRESWYTPTLFAATVRSDRSLWLRPALLACGIADIALLAAGIQAAMQDRLLRWVPVVYVASTVLVLVFMAIGALTAQAVLEVSDQEAVLATGTVEHQVAIQNAGNRSAYLLASPLQEASRLKNGYMLALQQRVGQESWRDHTGPLLDRAGWGGTAHSTQLLKIEPGQEAVLQASLPPGDYRLLLQNMASGQEVVETFAVAVPVTPPPVQPEEGLPPEGSPAQTETQAPEAEQHTPAFVDVELRGVVAADNMEPLFSFAIHFANGGTSEKNVTLGENLYGSWIVREYNPQRQMIVLSDGSAIITIRRGERVALP
jgi:hypothetical protein